MNNTLCFYDSNIWLYRFLIDPDCDDAEEVEKHNTATTLTDADNILISTQVINEVCAVLLKKAKISEIQIQQIIQEFYEGCVVIEIDYKILINASELRTSFSRLSCTWGDNLNQGLASLCPLCLCGEFLG